ncbi:hypothetical protein [Hyalangium rubrum]|uniref:Uncharacterized protein n=1 Tax=Hyalangium rubrum TaxID=3103134 RepID=A0ABU5HAQ9_9BACT|nr:hypothetical protein [Hyalangium sp. s54d21]MDY7229949.1 hypothetical protein [Hyalangium sp. s54d21]
MLSEARSLEWGSPRQLQLLAELKACCPAFVPGLLVSSRAMLWGKEGVQDPATFFDEVEQVLRHALEASGRETGALIGMARFMSVVRDSPQAAEPLYREAVSKALEGLEEAWAGLIETLGELEKTEEAARTAELARKVFPQSEQLSEASKYAKLSE